MEHYYYLHINGDLIHKPYIVTTRDPDYFTSDFVKKVWVLDTEKRETAWMLVVEALAMGASRNRIAELEKKWGLTNEDAEIFAKRMKLKITRSGTFFQAWDLEDYYKFRMYKTVNVLIIQIHMCSITFRDTLTGERTTLNVGTGATALDAIAELTRGMMRKRR